MRVGTFRFDPGAVAVVAVFLAITLGLAWGADSGLGFGPDQAGYNAWAEDLLAGWEQGRPLESESGSVYRRSFAALLAAGRLVLDEFTASYRLILFLSALAYLWAMYVLMASVIEHRAIAALTSVLSIVQRYTIGTSFWGMGEFQSILPRVVVLAVFPLAWLLFARHARSPRVVWAFVVAALGLALHLSAAYFYCILLMTYGLYVAWRREWPEVAHLALASVLFLFALAAMPSTAWSMVMDEAGPWAAAVILAALGLVLYSTSSTRHTSLRVGALLCLGACVGLLLPPYVIMWGRLSPQAAAPASLEALNGAIYARFGWTLFPISGATLGFALYNGGLVGAVALWEFVRRWRRGPTERERLVGLFVISVVTVSLGLTAAVQLYCRITGRPDIVLELFRAFRFIYLPMYIYLGLFLERQWRRARAPGQGRLRWLLAALVVALLLPPRQTLAVMPDRLKLMVRAAAEQSLHEGDPSQRQYLEALLATDAERRVARARHRDFVELGEWVRRSTPEDAVFMTTDYNFIHHAGRNIMISYPQGAPGGARSKALVSGYVAWHEALETISGAFSSRSPARILAAARRYEVDYIVVDAAQPELPLPLAHANDSYSLYEMTP